MNSIQLDGPLGASGQSATSGYPPGWAGGIHGWDIYAGGTIGAGPSGGSAQAYMNSGGQGYFASTLNVNGNIVTNSNLYVAARGMWMSETARDDGGQFWYGNGGSCPSGSLVASINPVWNGSLQQQGYFVLCQWIN